MEPAGGLLSRRVHYVALPTARSPRAAHERGVQPLGRTTQAGVNHVPPSARQHRAAQSGATRHSCKRGGESLQ